MPTSKSSPQTCLLSEAFGVKGFMKADTPTASLATPAPSQPESTSRRKVRFTFGYNSTNSSPSSPSQKVLPPSPSLPDTYPPSSSSTEPLTCTSTSSPVSITSAAWASTSSLNDTLFSVPTRTSSIGSPPPSRPTSRCGSMNSGISFTGSLDHRTMPRPAPALKNKPLPATPVESLSSASFDAVHASPASSPKSASQPLPSSTATTSTKSSFLSSAPVRSTITRPHLKHLSKAATNTSTSIMMRPSDASSSSPSLSNHHHNNNTSKLNLNLEKRRWSNDSTRGLHGTASYLHQDPFPIGKTSSSSTSSLPSITSSCDTLYDGPDTKGASLANEHLSPPFLNSDATSTMSASSFFSVPSPRRKRTMTTSEKKPCPTVTFFKYIMKK